MKSHPLDFFEPFTSELPADKELVNERRQVRNACFSYVEPKTPANPSLIHASPEMMQLLGISNLHDEKRFSDIFSGAVTPEGSKPYAMCYGGHQFGNWAGQLGDGRAINLGKVEGVGGPWTLQLKGAGETPYSRNADGLAVLRSSVREYLCSEAMHHLGVPTTRALSLMLSGDSVLRDILYNGNPAYEKGAIVCRVAPSFIRFGNFEILAAQKDITTLRALVDYTIRHHFSHLGAPNKAAYLAFFKEVSLRSMEMVVHWQRVGFVHGVMNTDNMSILGLTIDYGPYGWLEGYDPEWTPNTTDSAHKRYRYGTQPELVLWNLVQLANALYPLIEAVEPLQDILDEYRKQVGVAQLDMMRSKLGLFEAKPEDEELVTTLETALQATETDMTLFYRTLSQFDPDSPEMGIALVGEAFYSPGEVKGAVADTWNSWFALYAQRLRKELATKEKRTEHMNAVNPKYVLRNYMAQMAIDAAEEGDYDVMKELFTMLKKPYDEQPSFQKWFAKRPEWARNKVGCSMLSCSS